MQKVVTHSGAFHADDVFAVAALQIHFGPENVEVIRSRDEAIISSGDIVVDVGGIYDPDKGRFDHHQLNGPVRENGIPYAAFGLIWKHYGEQICGDLNVSNSVEESLVLPVDANDNGVALYKLNEFAIKPFNVSAVIGLFNPLRGSVESFDPNFQIAVTTARNILERLISHARAKESLKKIVADVYAKTDDKRVLQFDSAVPKSLLVEYPEALFIVAPDDPASSSNWLATAIPVSKDSFELRDNFPAEWSGLRDSELAKASGIDDAVFCHRNLFLFVARSQEGCIEAVKKALGE